MKKEINTFIFDLGGVLVDWKPEYLYRKIFNGDEEKVQWFLNNVCTPEWNMEQDAGRTITEGNTAKIAEFPEYEKEIELFYKDWTQMFSGPISKNLELFKKLKASDNYKVYALTNWGAEKWDTAIELFPFFKDFDGAVVSGFEKTRKPYPHIYKILLDRFNIQAENSIFIDDNLENVKAANSLNINAIQFKTNKQLISDLQKYHISL